jgi:hypothetical protein
MTKTRSGSASNCFLTGAQQAPSEETKMNTLMIHTLIPVVRYDEATAGAPLFNLEKLAGVAAFLVRAVRSFAHRIGGSKRRYATLPMIS